MKTTDIIQPSKTIVSSLNGIAEEYLYEFNRYIHKLLYEKTILNELNKLYPEKTIVIKSKDKNIKIGLDGKSRNSNIRMAYDTENDLILFPIYSLYGSNYFNSPLVFEDIFVLFNQFLKSPMTNKKSKMHKEIISCLIHELTHKIQNYEGISPEMEIEYKKGDKIDNAIERRAYYNQMLSYIHQKNPKTMDDIIKIANNFEKGSTFEHIYRNNMQEFLEIANDWLDLFLMESESNISIDLTSDTILV